MKMDSFLCVGQCVQSKSFAVKNLYQVKIEWENINGEIEPLRQSFLTFQM